MSRKLDDLSNAHGFRQLVFEFLARLTEAGIHVMVIDTLRTQIEQLQNIDNGVSWTKNSLHLPQEPDSKSLAIDIAPYEIWKLNGVDKLNWDINNPVWEKIAVIGEELGLTAGYRWKQRDGSHFQYKPRPTKIVKSYIA